MWRFVWLLIGVCLVSQVVALVVWGHAVYLWVQGTEALAAAVPLTVFGLRYRRHDPRRSRWPPLLPLGAVAALGGTKDLFVAAGLDIPLWVVLPFLASVAWFFLSSVILWRSGGRPSATPDGDEPR